MPESHKPRVEKPATDRPVQEREDVCDSWVVPVVFPGRKLPRNDITLLHSLYFFPLRRPTCTALPYYKVQRFTHSDSPTVLTGLFSC